MDDLDASIRTHDLRDVTALLADWPVVALLGPRQVGKTTLARAIAAERPETVVFDLEDPRDLARLTDPMLALEPLRGLVVLDEIQRRPELFPALRVLADRRPLPARFLVLGSASPTLLKQTSETLAGRIAHHTLGGFSLADVGAEHRDRLWLRGGYPRSFLARDDATSHRWRQELTRTYLERDLPALDVRIGADTLRRFWTMIAHDHGQVWNGAELARAFGVSDKTVRAYLDVLVDTFMVRRLAPWHANLAKRQVKAPKVYLTDSGLLHTLLDLRNRHDLDGHPKVGASFEGFAIDVVLRHLRAQPDEAYFWATHGGAELDLLVVRGGQRRAFEFKRTDSPTVTPSMRHALADLELDHLDVVHVGRDTFPLAPKIRAVSIDRLLTDVAPLDPG